MATRSRLRDYGGRMLTIDGRPTVQLIDPNDNARRRFQYRRTDDGGIWCVDRRGRRWYVVTRDARVSIDTAVSDRLNDRGRGYATRLDAVSHLPAPDDAGIERRVLAHDGQPFRDTGSPWEPVSPSDLAAMWRVRGQYHPILDPLGVLQAGMEPA